MSYASPEDSSAQLAGEKNVPTRAGRRSGVSPWLKVGVPVAIIAVILAAVLGGVLGSRAAKNNSNKAVGASDGSSSDGTTKSSRGSATGSSSGAVATALAAPGAGNVTIVPLKAWEWGTDKAIGMCLGELEVAKIRGSCADGVFGPLSSSSQWMDEDWFISVAGANSWDQWDFTQNLGDKAAAALDDHYSSWVTEADIEVMFQHGVNQLRIPTGFWSWIPTVAGEPYVNAGEVAYLEKAMAWCHARGMYVLIDLHGLPGSQNGEESSGHNTTSPAWFGNTVNQGRSDAMVLAVLDFVAKSPYRSVVAGLEVINEPRPYTPAQYTELSDYYSRSYTAIQASAWPITMFIHGAFIANQFTYWLPFVSARVTNPPSLVFEDHPYPGNFPIQNNTADILSQVCTAANKYLGFPVPIVITEWSVYTGVKTAAFETSFYASQLTTWAWNGGSHYWSFKLIPSSIQLSIGLDYSQYSWITLVNNATGTIPTLASANLPNATTPDNANAFLSSLTGNCGVAPANTAPYNTGAVSAWLPEASALSSAATVTLKATGTAGSRVRRRFQS
ncbi:hypothetical protein P7C70_g4030, partial [Phenoliferia sp. Uapishka_3]